MTKPRRLAGGRFGTDVPVGQTEQPVAGEEVEKSREARREEEEEEEECVLPQYLECIRSSY